MKTLLVAAAVAALLGVVAAQIHARLLDDSVIALTALFFLVGVVTAVAVERFNARQQPPPRDRAPQSRDAGEGRGRRGGRGGGRERSAQSGAERAGREHGTVKWFDANKGYGFVIREDESEIFVHHAQVRGGPLKDGQAVSFVAVERQRGWQAEQVSAE